MYFFIMEGGLGSGETDSSALNELVTFQVTHLANKLNAQSTYILQKHSDLKLVEWRVLRQMATIGQVSSIMNLAADMMIDKGQLSRTLKGMARKGLVTVEAAEEDHRTHLVRTTRAGEAMFADVQRVSRNRQAFLTADVSEEDLSVFMRVLETISNAADIREFPDSENQ